MKTKKENNKSKILICQLFLGHDIVVAVATHNYLIINDLCCRTTKLSSHNILIINDLAGGSAPHN
jgi:hypothetical protein